MNPEQIKLVTEQVQKALANPANYPWLVLIIGIVLVSGAAWLGAYLAEKGKAKAVSEDIRKLTDAIERAKQPFSEKAEWLKSKLHFRNIALERRLSVCQDFYEQWIIARSKATASKGTDLSGVRDLLELHQRTCLYLSKEAESAFFDCIVALQVHHALSEGYSLSKEEFVEHWRKINEFGKALRSDVELPAEMHLEVLDKAQEFAAKNL